MARRYRRSSLVLLTAAFVCQAAASSLPSSNLTVVLSFKGTHSEQSITYMQREAEVILQPAGLSLDWKMAQEAARSNYSDLVVVRFKGTCKVEPIPFVYDELGPLAFTFSADGTVQPFGEVACDKVAASVRSAMWGSDVRNPELLLGRALGRVLVHELVHMLTRSGEHARDGVERSALSGQQLIATSLPLSVADLARIRRSQKSH
jgi:hypothetical protein